MTVEQFIIALIKLKFYKSFPEDYAEKIKEYELLTDKYIEDKLTD